MEEQSGMGLEFDAPDDILPFISEEWIMEDMYHRVKQQNDDLHAYVQRLQAYICEIETRERNLLQSLLAVPQQVWVTIQRPEMQDAVGFLQLHRNPCNRDITLTVKTMDYQTKPNITYTLKDKYFAWVMQSLSAKDNKHASVLWIRLQCGSSFTLAFQTETDRAKFDSMLRSV
tara:strand:- start:405 stop:923 length:519 start_codon:yes stop_codon:yes gene_type:complete